MMMIEVRKTEVLRAENGVDMSRQRWQSVD